MVMRFFWFLLLVAFLAAVGMFAWQNAGDVTLTFFDRQLTASLALLIGAVYLIGMFSGWTVLGMLRRASDRIVER
jgi:putative membrane protein